MAKSEAKKRADAKWNAKAYYRPQIYIRREYADDVKARVSELNTTMSSYIQALIKKDLESHIL